MYSALRPGVVTRDGSSGSVRLVDARSVNEQRMKEHRVARLHLEVHPVNRIGQVLENRGAAIKENDAQVSSVQGSR